MRPCEPRFIMYKGTSTTYYFLPERIVSKLMYCFCACIKEMNQFFFLFFLFFYFFSWRLITLQYCSGFCHTFTRIGHGFTLFPIPIPPPISLSTRSLWVFPVHQVRALVSCMQLRLVICFTLDNIQVSMLFS